MLLAFELHLDVPSSVHHSSLRGTTERYVRVRTIPKAQDPEGLIGAYSYRWDDGWLARVDVRQVDSKEATKLRRVTAGFYGYDWMINSIVARRQITTEA